MEKIGERELRKRLERFEDVWRRVGVAGAPRETAERCGVRLMPRQRCCARKKR